jgi:hypothetical protein
MILFLVSILKLSAQNIFNRSIMNYILTDTGQNTCYNDSTEIECPGPDESFYGQDAQYQGIQFSFRNNGDGTITDLNTGLMWQKTPDLDDKSTFAEADAGASIFNLAAYNDWRLPDIKELYSLIDFRGSSFKRIPYIDTDFFGFRFGDESRGERLIDAQYWSRTEYTGTTMNADATVFGVNFADGRIKGYPRDNKPDGSEVRQFVRYVRGNDSYGVNHFVDNGDSTITDLSTNLMWQKSDDGIIRNWEQALNYAEKLELAEYNDWRLPNAKELQSIVDYTRAPDASDFSQQGPAIDVNFFGVSETESWFWTSTTLLETPPQKGAGSHAVYICFGQAFGWMERPSGSGNYVKLNVHGAGAQRSDPKSGDPDDYPYGHGPQGDEIRIYNYVRCVRSVSLDTTGISRKSEIFDIEDGFVINQNYPNPFNRSTKINIKVPVMCKVLIKIFDLHGSEVRTLICNEYEPGWHLITWNGSDNAGKAVSSGVYLLYMKAGNYNKILKTSIIK